MHGDFLPLAGLDPEPGRICQPLPSIFKKSDAIVENCYFSPTTNQMLLLLHYYTLHHVRQEKKDKILPKKVKNKFDDFL